MNGPIGGRSRELGVTRAALSRVLHGHAGISPEMALRIERWLGVERGGRAEVWAGMQLDYDLWRARQGKAASREKGAGTWPCIHHRI